MRATILTLLLLANLSAQTKPAETPQRTIRDTTPFKPNSAPAADRAAGARTLDSLGASTQDLNAIRDANLTRITKDGCAPEVSARIAELRGKLLVYTSPAADPPSRGPDKPTPPPAAANSAAAVAADWYKAPPGRNPSRPSGAKDPLDAVLPSGALKTPGQKAAEQDVATLKVELEHLSAACPGAKQ